MAYKLDKNLEKYFSEKKRFYLPRICYRAWIKYPNRKDKVYINIVGYEDDIWTKDVEKKHACLWQEFSEFVETLQSLFWKEIEDGDVEYVKIEPCIKCVKPWWKEYEKTWFEYVKNCIISFFNFRINEYKSMRHFLIGEYGKWKTFWKNPIWDLILPHRWIKNWISRILYIKEKSIINKDNI